MPMTPSQRAWRERFEAAIGVAAPFLDLVMNVGEGVSRVLAGPDVDYYPVRGADDAVALDERARREVVREAAQAGD
jgi:hypothetical protein